MTWLSPGPRRRRLPLYLLAPFLIGCAPRWIPAGLPSIEPVISPNAFVMADGARLPFRAWLPTAAPQAVLLGLHGFGDYSVNAFHLAAPLLTAEGIALYAYDQRGFGGAPNRGIWPGGPTLVGDAIAVARLIRARHPGVPLFLLGESMGVAVLLVAGASSAPPAVDGYVLLAPAVRGRATMTGLARGVLDIASHLIPAIGFYPSAPGFAPTDNADAMIRWGQDPLTLKTIRVDMLVGLVDLMDDALGAAPHFTARALVLYGGRDGVVAEAPVHELMAALPRTPLRRAAFYPEGHHLLLRDRNRQVVARDIAAWMRTPDSPLPSGCDRLAPEGWN